MAAQALVEEAGGRYTDMRGDSLDFERPLQRGGDTYAMCAAPAALHAELNEIPTEPP